MNSLLKTAALRYAAEGWPVFFLGRSKRPVANCDACAQVGPEHDREACQCLACHGLYAATLDGRRIASIFAVIPQPMLAIRTGLASRLVVIDVDPAHGGEDTLASLVEQDLCPPTALVRTGSGGHHLYYRHPGIRIPCSQGRLGVGIDVRGDGGYVVAPPSIHPRSLKPYAWVGTRPVTEMPRALIEACQPPASPLPAATQAPRFACGEGITAPDRLLASLLESVAQAPEGKRRTTLYGASRGVARMVAAGVLDRLQAWTALTAAGRAAQQTEREIRTAIAGGFKDEGVMP